MEHAWIVSSDDEVEAALTHPHLVVRPPDEPIPRAMLGTALGNVFGRLARMNDGERHSNLRAGVESRLTEWNMEQIRRVAATASLRLIPENVAAYTIATLIGLRDPDAALPWIRDFAAAIAFGADAATIARGIVAAENLIAALPASDDPNEAANALGLLFQAYAATARLIEAMTSGSRMPPVILTRRWAADDMQFCGTSIRRGDAVVILLTSPRFHFGAGPHACPGQRIANAIAEATLQGISTTHA